MITVTFNGKELPIIVTKGFTAFNGADYQPELYKYDVLSGGGFSYTRKAVKRIDITFYVDYKSVEKYDELQAILNVTSPKRLIFSHVPNRVFYAVPVGDLNFEEYKMNGQGTLSFLIPDGLSHSTTKKSFSFSKNQNGIYETTITNNGSESVAVDYHITLAKESGFIGIVSQHGAIQFGKREEVDGVDEQKNVVLVENKNGNFNNWRNGTTFYENIDKKAATTMESAATKGLGVLPNSFTNTTNSAFYGAIKEILLSENAKDWYVWSKAWFETGLMGQTGAWCLSIVDSSNQFIAGMAIEKRDMSGNTAEVLFLLRGADGNSRVVKRIPFSANFFVSDNPYGSQSKEQGRNMFDLRKEQDKVTFYWYGQQYSFYESSIKNMQAKLIQFFVGQFSGRNTTNQFVTHHYLNDFSFTKMNVPYWKDVPNRYPNNAKLFIDGTVGTLSVNQKIALDDELLGSNYFKVPPGDTKVQLLLSSFSNVISASATIREAFT